MVAIFAGGRRAGRSHQEIVLRVSAWLVAKIGRLIKPLRQKLTCNLGPGD